MLVLMQFSVHTLFTKLEQTNWSCDSSWLSDFASLPLTLCPRAFCFAVHELLLNNCHCRFPVKTFFLYLLECVIQSPGDSLCKGCKDLSILQKHWQHLFALWKSTSSVTAALTASPLQARSAKAALLYTLFSTKLHGATLPKQENPTFPLVIDISIPFCVSLKDQKLHS